MADAKAPAAVASQALRDAQVIAERVAADQAAAAEASARYAREGLPVMSDRAFDAVAQTGERLHAVHRSALLEPWAADQLGAQPVSGTLFLTSHRLVHAGPTTVAVSLDQIAGSLVALQRLVLIRLRDGTELAVQVTQPHLLKVQIEAAQTS